MSPDEVNSQLSALERTVSTLVGADMDKVKETRMALAKQAMSEMDNDEKKELKSAMDKDMVDQKEKSAMSEDKKDDNKTAMSEDKKDDSKTAMSDGDDKKDEKIKALEAKLASLTASMSGMVSQPKIEAMLTARANAGMSQQALMKFRSSLVGKSTEQIEQRYAEDEIFFYKPLISSNNGFAPQQYQQQQLQASQSPSQSQFTGMKGIPFNGGADLFQDTPSTLAANTVASGQQGTETLEELLN